MRRLISGSASNATAQYQQTDSQYPMRRTVAALKSEFMLTVLAKAPLNHPSSNSQPTLPKALNLLPPLLFLSNATIPTAPSPIYLSKTIKLVSTNHTTGRPPFKKICHFKCGDFSVKELIQRHRFPLGTHLSLYSKTLTYSHNRPQKRRDQGVQVLSVAGVCKAAEALTA
jgi:hypothetical protein